MPCIRPGFCPLSDPPPLSFSAKRERKSVNAVTHRRNRPDGSLPQTTSPGNALTAVGGRKKSAPPVSRSSSIQGWGQKRRPPDTIGPVNSLPGGVPGCREVSSPSFFLSSRVGDGRERSRTGKRHPSLQPGKNAQRGPAKKVYSSGVFKLPSSSSKTFFRSRPPAYPVRELSAPMIRWHGMRIMTGFCAIADATARA